MNNIKRAELHLHTKLSDDVSVIGAMEVFEKAENLGLKSVAFTNLNNVQDFPEIMRCAKKFNNIKVIYGAEVRYMSKDRKSPYGITILAKNQAGIKELYKVISSIKNDGVCDLIDLKVLKQNRKNLLVGSCGNMGELYEAVANNKVTEKTSAFYDYFEIYPTNDKAEKDIYQKIYTLGEELGVPVVATGNCHYISSDDAICREIVMKAEREFKKGDNGELYIRTAEQMLEDFSYLGTYGAQKAVLENPQILTDVIEKVKPLKEDNYYPVFENAHCDLQNLCYRKAYEIYGNPLPQTVKERLDTELGFLKDEQFATQYLIAKRIVDFAKENGQLTMSRGAVGSTLTAFLLGISEINPLAPHYYCSDCHYFEKSPLAYNGFDLPRKICPVCKKELKTDGHNIPYETFMAFKGEKLPDIDLNLPANFKLKTYKFMEKMFGANKVLKGGTISTVFENLAEHYIYTYESIQKTKLDDDKKGKIINKLIGIKTDVGMHPGGVMVIPKGMDFEDFTPINLNFAPFPTTHFDFHALHNTILKQDLLGIYSLDFLMLLKEFTGKSINDVDLNDSEIHQFFTTADTLGIPEFNTDFMRNLLKTTKPKNFTDLLKIIGLSHGTNVWLDNGELLVKNGVPISKIPCLRDDIMNDLISICADKVDAFRLTEAVRKGLFAKNQARNEDVELLKELSSPLGDWYFDYCSKIRYIFPKAHATEYVIAALRLAWFKRYYPTEFYAAYLSCYLSFDEELTEEDRLQYKKIISECSAKGIELLKPDAKKSHFKNYLPENGNIRMPYIK